MRECPLCDAPMVGHTCTDPRCLLAPCSRCGGTIILDTPLPRYPALAVCSDCGAEEWYPERPRAAIVDDPGPLLGIMLDEEIPF